MNKKILSLSMMLAMLALAALPMAVSADENTTVVGGTVPGPLITVTAPSAIALGDLPYNYSAAQQVVGSSLVSGNVTVDKLRHRTYKVEVSGSSANLTGPSTPANDLQFATGNSGSTLMGNVLSAAAITPINGTWADPAGVVVPVTVAAQTIKAGILSTAAPFVLALTVFQKVNANEPLATGNYTLTLTYTATIVP